MQLQRQGAAEVCHVDIKGNGSLGKENAEISGLKENRIRFLVDDVFKFVEKEIRRGNRYDAVIMDPPSYGRGPREKYGSSKMSCRLLELTS